MNTNFKSIWSLPFLLLIKLYQLLRDVLINPLLQTAFGSVGQCRYEETCSRYSVRMLKEHATIPALQKILLRLAKCHGF